MRNTMKMHQNYNATIKFRLPDSDYADFRIYCGIMGYTPSIYLRQLIQSIIAANTDLIAEYTEDDDYENK